MPDDPGQRLAELWGRLEKCLREAGDGRADRIRLQVLNQFDQPERDQITTWLNQAVALFNWHAISAETARGGRPGPLARLQDRCKELRHRLAEQQHAVQSRFFGLFAPPKGQQELFSDLHTFLADCGNALQKMASEPGGDKVQILMCEVQKALSQLEEAWPPNSLANFFQSDPSGAGADLSALRTLLEPQAKQWRATLATKLPELSADDCDRLLLLRGIIEAAGASPQAWPALSDFARRLLPPSRVQVAVVCDPEQPREWFEMPRQDDVPEPKVEHCGLVVRLGDGPWLGFPPARLVVPQPAPPGFHVLRRLLHPPEGDAEAAVWNRVNEWKQAAKNGTLELAAVQFFVDFWGELGDLLRKTDPDKAREVARLLAELMPGEFKLYPFYPVAFQDYPDGWLQRLPGPNMVTGKVLRVVRPGLQDEQQHIRVPALVEVE
jgi:hypothetical protein